MLTVFGALIMKTDLFDKDELDGDLLRDLKQ